MHRKGIHLQYTGSSQNVVLSLTNNLFNKGRTIYTDNYYSSMALTYALHEKNNHLVGALRSNRKLNLKQVIYKKLKKGEADAAESNTGIVVQKWKEILVTVADYINT